jgi:hypothetical protein
MGTALDDAQVGLGAAGEPPALSPTLATSS